MSSLGDNDRPPASGRPAWIFWGIVLVVVVALFAARPSLAWWARHSAADHLQAGRISQAEQWLGRATRLDSNSAATQVLIARSYRHLDQRQNWRELMDRADAGAAGSAAVRNEKRLGALQWGEVESIANAEWERLVESGVDRDEAAMALARGRLLAGDDQQLERLLNEWEEATRHPQQPAFLRGVVANSKQNAKLAKVHLQTALELEPDHEMAHVELAQILEQSGDYSAALEHFSYWAQHRPSNEQAVTGWSRVLRLLGRADEARGVMQQLASSADDSVSLALEWAEVEYALGNYDDAVRWFRLADLDGAHYSTTLRTAATALALKGEGFAAETIFDRVMSVQDRQRRIEELQKRVMNDASDRRAANELQKIAERPVDTSSATATGARRHPVSRLFSEHCASCHGLRGDADGPASRHLYPPARNLRTDSYRLVTSTNRHPLPADIEAVIRDGIPGTAMPAFAELSDNEREELTAQVYQLRREGMRSQLMEQFRNVGEPIDEETADELVRQRFAEARPVEVPEAQDLSSASRRAEGQQLYDQAGCVQCHGPDGRGIFDVPLFNEDGSHAIPRDLALEPWKGGESPEALFARIRVGMPGTPHPENPTLDDEQIISLVAYCLSISNETKVARTNRQRGIQANERAIQARFGAEQ